MSKNKQKTKHNKTQKTKNPTRQQPQPNFMFVKYREIQKTDRTRMSELRIGEENYPLPNPVITLKENKENSQQTIILDNSSRDNTLKVIEQNQQDRMKHGLGFQDLYNLDTSLYSLIANALHRFQKDYFFEQLDENLEVFQLTRTEIKHLRDKFLLLLKQTNLMTSNRTIDYDLDELRQEAFKELSDMLPFLNL